MTLALARPIGRDHSIPASRVATAVLTLTGPAASLRTHTATAWASITFSGWRHQLVLRFTGPFAIGEGERFIAALPEHEFALRGALVADAAVTRVAHTQAIDPPHLEVTVELLVLDED